jgi:hypothetical protein
MMPMRTPEPSPPWRTLAPDEYPQAFQTLFTRSAFRLEQLDQYASAVEVEPFQRYLRGEPDDLAWHQPWLDFIDASVSAGKTMSRVRVVTEPWSDYTAWELTVAHSASVLAGDNIRVLPRDSARLGIDHDFWLTEEPATVARMLYTPAGEWTGAHVTDDPAITRRYAQARDDVTAASVPLQTYLASVRRRTA